MASWVGNYLHVRGADGRLMLIDPEAVFTVDAWAVTLVCNEAGLSRYVVGDEVSTAK